MSDEGDKGEAGVRSAYRTWALHPCVRGVAFARQTPWMPLEAHRVQWGPYPWWWPEHSASPTVRLAGISMIRL